MPGSGNVRRLSNCRPATSPTASTPDSYVSQTPHGFRSSPMEKVIVLVTADAEKFNTVDITGAMTPAFIRERIFTKLQISDEDQSRFSIYPTEIGMFATGDALSDEELFDLYRERGDANGSLKLLVSYTSAPVHEPSYDAMLPSPTVNTLPPPVLPQQSLYAPLRPKPRGAPRRNSQSSASEPQHAEIGYEASVSDDLEHGEQDVRREVRRPLAQQQRTLPNPIHRPSSPMNYPRTHSPSRTLSPDRSMVQNAEYNKSRPEAPVQMPRLLPSEEPGIRRGKVVSPDAAENKRRGEAWTMVPSDLPSSEYKTGRPTTPQEVRSPSRFPATPSSLGSLANSYVPRAPPPAPSGSGESRSHKRMKAVPHMWAVSWKPPSGPSNTDQKPVPPPPSKPWLRAGAKSMTDMRATFHKQGLQPGRTPRPPPQLPFVSRPATGGSSTANAASTGYAPSLSTGTSYAGLSPAQDPYPRPHSALGDSNGTPYRQPRQLHSPHNSESAYDRMHIGQRPLASHHYALGSQSTQVSREEPSTSQPDQQLDAPIIGPDHPVQLSRVPRTPPRSPVGTSEVMPFTNEELDGKGSELTHVPPENSGIAFPHRGVIDEDHAAAPTIRRDQAAWLQGIIDEDAAEGTARPRSVDPDDEDTDSAGGTIWAREPGFGQGLWQMTSSQGTRNTGRPSLPPLSIENSPSSIATPLQHRSPRILPGFPPLISRHRPNLHLPLALPDVSPGSRAEEAARSAHQQI
ncbi:hypothetical protein A0H81_00826 [Grifola frondosa]|uniref:Uncharacterized protein n=1 Tax=Grifola frondosa TaxID=5627 RepID=A0A1C7MRS6_GRIFR|nr:hypothetical protein A0H81_00826 [Grifola frondosa]